MNDHILLSYYLKELTALRETGKRFSQENPHLAQHLQMEQGSGQNPQLSQLIESLAFMNARISYQFEQDYPRLMNSLTEVLYPHLSTPIPSMAIIQWPVEKNLEKSFVVPRGTLVETDPSIMSSVRFSTAYDIMVHPINITHVQLLDSTELPLVYNLHSKSIIKLSLSSSNPKVTLASLNLEQLQFFLHGEENMSYHLYETLMRQCLAIAIIEKNDKGACVHWLNVSSLVAMGFCNDQAMLPQDARTLPGTRILAEFFTFPQKFLFLKLTELPKLNITCQSIEICFHLKNNPEKALSKISTEQFMLGCTPITNLFPKKVEPLEITKPLYEYPVITDLRRSYAYEIYQIQNVIGLHENNEINVYPSLFNNHTKSGCFWHAYRVPCSQINGNTLNGTELMMTVIQLPPVESSLVLLIDTLCTNRDLTRLMSQQILLPSLQLVHGNIPSSKINWIEKLTAPRPALFQNQDHFLLLQNLASNIFGLTSDNAHQFKNMLELYVKPEQKNFRLLIDSIADLRSERMSAFISQNHYHGYCNGAKLILQLDRRPTESMCSWFFFNVLEKYFSDLSPMNSFIKLHVLIQDEDFCEWPMRTSEQVFI